MLHASFCFVSKALHLDKIDRKVTEFVPRVKHNIYLAQEVALRIALEVEAAIRVLTDVKIVFLAWWARTATFTVRVRAKVKGPTCQMPKQCEVKSLQQILWLQVIGDHELPHGIVNARVASLLIHQAELVEAHFVEVRLRCL